jgi:hypothetical protein
MRDHEHYTAAVELYAFGALNPQSIIDVFQQSEAISGILEGISIHINLFEVDIHLKFLATLMQFEPMFDSPPDRQPLC